MCVSAMADPVSWPLSENHLQFPWRFSAPLNTKCWLHRPSGSDLKVILLHSGVIVPWSYKFLDLFSWLTYDMKRLKLNFVVMWSGSEAMYLHGQGKVGWLYDSSNSNGLGSPHKFLAPPKIQQFKCTLVDSTNSISYICSVPIWYTH